MYIFFTLIILLGIANTIYTFYKYLPTSYNFVTGMVSCSEDLYIVFSFLIFLTVYTEDYKSMTLITVIGKGYSRIKVVLAKFLDVVVTSVAVFLLYGIITVILSFVFRQNVLPEEAWFYIFSSVKYVLLMIGMTTFASIGIYATGSTAFSFLVLTVVMFTNDQLSQLLTYIPVIKKLRLDRILFGNVLKSGFSDVMLGSTAKGICVMCTGFVVYVGLALVAVHLIFNRKELDF